MPDCNPAIHHRHSIRLQGYDYSQDGMYFITVCTYQHENLFGEIHANNGEAEMILNEFGRLMEFTWQDLPNHNPGLELGPFVIMPNHIHGIIALVGADSVRAGSKPAQADSMDAGSIDANSPRAGPARAGSVEAGPLQAGPLQAGSVRAGSV